MAETVVAFLIKQLSTLLHQEYALLKGLRQGLQFINDELGTMRAFLRDVEAEHEQQSSEFQEWVKQVREVAYDTEDVIDELLLIFARRRRRRAGFYGRVQNVYTSIKTLRARHRVSTKINDIKCRVEDIYARHQRYKSDYGTGTSTAIEDVAVRGIRGRAILLEEADLVGIHVPKNELLSQILDNNSHLKVVSVMGMGGMGKTTLLRRVYEDVNVKRQFHSHAWVTISQTFKIESILKDLIQQLHAEIKELVPQEVESKDVDSLKVFLKDFLRKKRYIIILDDIWSVDAWEALIYALPDCHCSSRVMLTTRIAEVAFASCSQHSGYIHKMKALSDEESWTLFCNRSFEDKCCPPHLESVSRRILKKCEGLPLAIVSISGLLFLKDKNRLEEWEKVYRSLGGELEGTGKLNQVKKILLLSYNDLPYYLKGCLLYTSLYPEDFQISSWLLIEQWISEGFVQDRKGTSRVEIAEEYFNELVSRSLIQVARREVVGIMQKCHIHDLVREITHSIAEEHGIITIFKGKYTKRLGNARRLVFYNFINSAQENIPSKHLRSLIMFKYVDHMSTSSLLKLLCGRSKLLKVLDLNESLLETIPKDVFKLFHLRYLSLQGSKVKVIPKSIKNLQNLEFLHLSGTEVMELPTEILKLGKLRNLYVYQPGNHSNNYAIHGFKAPNEIGRLVSLESLFFIDADNGKIVREIGKLSQLRDLGITKLRREDGKQLCCSLEKLTNLRRLAIKEGDILDLQYSMSTVPQFLQFLVLEGRLEQVPLWVPSLQDLTELELYRSGLMEDPLECLQVLPNLLRLMLYQACEGETLCSKAGGFQKLRSLTLNQLKRLRHVTMEEGAMPRLKTLFMVGCESVKELPQGIQNLSELQEVVLYDMPKELTAELESGNKESENYRKIAHVPEIFIGNWTDGHEYDTKLRREDGKHLCCSLEKLTNLRRLAIKEGDILDLQYSMSTVPQFLQHLALEGRLEQVPQWVSSLQNLAELELYRSGLMEDQLECLQLLPNLLRLVLCQAYEGETLCSKAGGFQKLRWLTLNQLKRLRRVTMEEGAMPHLKTLFMVDCESVKELPQGIQNLSELQEVMLYDMPKELTAKLVTGNKESENYWKIARVP